MPVVGAAAVTAAGAITGALISSHDASKGRQSQQQNANAALDYQKSRDAQTEKDYQQRWNLYQAYVQDYIKRHGGSIGATGGGGGGSAPTSVSLSDLVKGQQGAPGATGTQPASGSVADLANGGDVFDWRRYGA